MDERARLQQHLHVLRAGPLQLQDLGNQHLVPLQLWGLCLRAVDGSGLDEGATEGYLEHLWDLLLLQVCAVSDNQGPQGEAYLTIKGRRVRQKCLGVLQAHM